MLVYTTQTNTCGVATGTPFHLDRFQATACHSIRQDLVLNTPGRRNGRVSFWLNGALGLQKSNVRFRNISSLKIDRLTLDTFFGGSAANQGPLRDEYIDFCRVRVCKLN